MKKAISNIIFIIYIIVAIFVTICLLSYNDYKITEFGDYSLVIVTDKKMEPSYNKGDLIIVEKSDEIETGKKVFYYDTYSKQIKVKLGTIKDIEILNEEQINYTIEDTEHQIANTFIIGEADEAVVMSKVGTVLKIIESRWGFLFIIVFPALLAFVNQLVVVVTAIKEAKAEEKKDEEKEIKNKVEKTEENEEK